MRITSQPDPRDSLRDCEKESFFRHSAPHSFENPYPMDRIACRIRHVLAYWLLGF
jgi:hypothetical protein